MYQKSMKDWKKHLDFIILDILCLDLAFLASYMTRYGALWVYSGKRYISLLLGITLLDLTLLIISRTMKNVLRRTAGREFIQTVKHVFLLMFLILSYMFAVKESGIYSRSILGLFAVYYVLLSYITRLLWKKYLINRTSRRKISLYVIASARCVEDVIQRYRQEKISHYLLTGICVSDEDRTGEEILGVPVNSKLENVLGYLCREWIDEVVIAVSKEESSCTDLIEKLIEMGIVVHIEMEETERFGWAAQEIEKIAGRRVLTVGMNMASPIQVCIKRAMDIAGGLVGCALTLILTVIIGPMIYAKSPGPIFFSQTRVGKNGKLFKMYKFRSMYLDAEERKAELMAQNRVSDGLMFKLDYDPRIIGCEKRPDGTIKKGIGNFIRDWSLDEFPQFFNCLKGDLSLVGTRPPTVDEWEKYELNHRGRLAIKPGITGMWQVSGRSRITDFDQVVELDKKYIREWSIWLDVKILLQTVKAVVGKDGAM